MRRPSLRRPSLRRPFLRRWPVLLAAGAGLACLVAGSALLLSGSGAADVGVVPPVVVSALPATPGTTPVTVEIPGRAVRAPVVPVGTAPTGAMELPADPRTVGWWSPGPLVGGRGSAVLAGHVDTAEAGLGALAVLREVEPGEEVVVRGADGRELRYAVTARREYPKADLPADLFTGDGPPGLVLITCGGDFDRATGHYEDNVVVHAVPA
ncbi:class F sortase [Pseudonocardia broussonetiae]|uniref:Class F sortase n=1 Tax=Pseudonocardia broussonetiae TaxID=2736640 RepID=A0A6M6JEK8_9PSEU|nr:class F sortase [Pseudonocardia broussonetiae]QJY44881.1 class F sortase [Pseudonocardia broussonetiae]